MWGSVGKRVFSLIGYELDELCCVIAFGEEPVTPDTDERGRDRDRALYTVPTRWSRQGHEMAHHTPATLDSVLNRGSIGSLRTDFGKSQGMPKSAHYSTGFYLLPKL